MRNRGPGLVDCHIAAAAIRLGATGITYNRKDFAQRTGYVLLMACLLYSVLEWLLRDANVPIPSPSCRVLTRPTGHEVVWHLASLQVTRTRRGSEPSSYRKFPWSLMAIFGGPSHAPRRFFGSPITQSSLVKNLGSSKF